MSAQPAFAAPPSPAFPSRFVDVDGVRLHYLDEGVGPALFMLHGNPTSSFLYRHVIGALRDAFRCVAIDLPGFGLSDIPDRFSFLPEDHARYVGRFLEILGLRDATLVAHDWGGPIGLAAALARPEALTRFALGNSWAWPVNGDFHFEWFSRLMGGPVGRFGARRFGMFVELFIPGGLRRGRPAPEVMDAYRAPFRDRRRREGTHVFPREIIAGREFLGGIERKLGRLKGAPVLFVWPDADIAFREKELRRWLTYFPDARVERIARCGHFLWEEAPDEAVAAIRRWAAGAGRAGG